MPLLEITTSRKVTATVSLEEPTANLVNQYAAFTRVAADDVVNKALEYVFTKDKDFQKFISTPNDTKPLATGQKITPEVFDGIMFEVKKRKRAVAVETQQDLERA